MRHAHSLQVGESSGDSTTPFAIASPRRRPPELRAPAFIRRDARRGTSYSGSPRQNTKSSRGVVLRGKNVDRLHHLRRLRSRLPMSWPLHHRRHARARIRRLADYGLGGLVRVDVAPGNLQARREQCRAGARIGLADHVRTRVRRAAARVDLDRNLGSITVGFEDVDDRTSRDVGV